MFQLQDVEPEATSAGAHPIATEAAVMDVDDDKRDVTSPSAPPTPGFGDGAKLQPPAIIDSITIRDNVSKRVKQLGLVGRILLLLVNLVDFKNFTSVSYSDVCFSQIRVEFSDMSRNRVEPTAARTGLQTAMNCLRSIVVRRCLLFPNQGGVLRYAP
jgi:hypothetical protein